MDVVTAKREDWERDPFQFIEENGYFYGRGTFDDKQGVVAITSTFLRLKAEKFVPNRDLILFFSGDEETAQDTTLDIVKKHRALIDAEFALNGDAGGGILDDASGKPLYFSLQTAEKTYADFSVSAHNAGGHSSQPRDDNAIYDLAAALIRLRDFKLPVMWNDTTLAALKQTGALIPGELGAAIRKFAADPRDAAAAEVISHSPTYVGITRTTCVATMLDGGHAQNALPQSASANVNCRIFPGVKIEDVRQALQAAAGAAVEVKLIGTPLSSDASQLRPDVVKAVTRAVQCRAPRRAGGAGADLRGHRRPGVPFGGHPHLRRRRQFHEGQRGLLARPQRAPVGAVVLRQPEVLVRDGDRPVRQDAGRSS